MKEKNENGKKMSLLELLAQKEICRPYIYLELYHCSFEIKHMDEIQGCFQGEISEQIYDRMHDTKNQYYYKIYTPISHKILRLKEGYGKRLEELIEKGNECIREWEKKVEELNESMDMSSVQGIFDDNGTRLGNYPYFIQKGIDDCHELVEDVQNGSVVIHFEKNSPLHKWFQENRPDVVFARCFPM